MKDSNALAVGQSKPKPIVPSDQDIPIGFGIGLRIDFCAPACKPEPIANVLCKLSVFAKYKMLLES